MAKRTKYRPFGKLWSVFTDDMEHCIYTGSPYVERHHIFGGANKWRSEKYGFIAPLRPDLHPNGVHAGKDSRLIDQALKKMAQTYYENHYGTREDFIKEFGKSYLED